MSRRQGRHRFVLGTIRRRDGAGEDQPAIDVRGDVPLESIEPLALALAAVTHLRSAIETRRSAATPSRMRDAAALRIGLQILRPDLHQGLDMRP